MTARRCACAEILARRRDGATSYRSRYRRATTVTGEIVKRGDQTGRTRPRMAQDAARVVSAGECSTTGFRAEMLRFDLFVACSELCCLSGLGSPRYPRLRCLMTRTAAIHAYVASTAQGGLTDPLATGLEAELHVLTRRRDARAAAVTQNIELDAAFATRSRMALGSTCVPARENL